jgi:FKBP-type peptidyl-prolyl cis-trans isomerase FkpA
MKYFLGLLFLAVMGISCSKNESGCAEVNIKAPDAEIAALRAYITGSGITATEDPRGFFYTIDVAGTGKKPTACSDVTVNYAGRLTNGTQFDAGTDVSFNLSQLIVGWQQGIPLLNEGGTMTLYLPPSLAYGPNAVGIIPANSILIFTIKLNTVF